jgi:hypothetical protein
MGGALEFSGKSVRVLVLGFVLVFQLPITNYPITNRFSLSGVRCCGFDTTQVVWPGKVAGALETSATDNTNRRKPETDN